MTQTDLPTKEDSIWEEGGFIKSVSKEELEKKKKSINMRHDEDINYNCKKCNKKISLHNKDWHDEMCDECFDETYYPKSKKKEKKMNLKEYQEACKRTAKEFATAETEIATWGLGVAGEAGDIASCIKKVFAHKNEAIKEGLKENLGDTIWYIAMICNFFDWDLEEVLDENIEKLRKRYPEGFTFKDAQREGTMIKWSGFDKDEKYVKPEDKNEK